MTEPRTMPGDAGPEQAQADRRATPGASTGAEAAAPPAGQPTRGEPAPASARTDPAPAPVSAPATAPVSTPAPAPASAPVSAPASAPAPARTGSATAASATGEGAPVAPLFDFAEALGGRRGVVDASLPGFVLVVVNVATGLGWAIVAAVITSAVIGVLRITRKEPLRQAASGVIGIGLAALLAAYTGNAKNFFLPGILINGAYVVGTLASVAARRPALGYIAAALDRRFTGWRDDATMVRRATYATLVWTAIFAVRFVLQGWLYLHDHVGWLATARLAMGWPLWGLAVMASLLLLQPPDEDEQHPSVGTGEATPA